MIKDLVEGKRMKANKDNCTGVNICPKTNKPFPNDQFQYQKLFPENGA